MTTIRLYHPHTHEGVAYDPPPEGIELTVNDADAGFLDALGLTTPPPVLNDASADTADAVADARDPAHDDAHVDVATDEDTAA